MADTLFISVVLHLFLCNQVQSSLRVNINYDIQDGVSTCTSNEETISCCQQRGLLVSGKMHSIGNDKITASSSINDVHHQPHDARLFNTAENGVWVPKNGEPDPWIQFDLGKPMTILAVVTRGRKDTKWNQFVTSYKVTYVATPQQYLVGNWKMAFYKPAPELASADLTIFPGNLDRNTLQVNYLEEPVSAQYVRIYPVTYNEDRSLRADFIGCL